MSFLSQLPSAPAWIAWLAGAGLLALGIARCMPGVSGAVANLVWGVLAPRASKEADARQAQLAAAAQFVFSHIEEAKPDLTVAALKEKFVRKMPESIKETVRTWQDDNAP